MGSVLQWAVCYSGQCVTVGSVLQWVEHVRLQLVVGVYTIFISWTLQAHEHPTALRRPCSWGDKARVWPLPTGPPVLLPPAGSPHGWGTTHSVLTVVNTSTSTSIPLHYDNVEGDVRHLSLILGYSVII